MMGEYRLRDLRDPRENLPNIEHGCEGSQQFVRRLDVPHAVSLERERVLQRLVALRVLNG